MIESDIQKIDFVKSIKNCTLCGLCKSFCPIYLIKKSESDSPRGKTLLITNEISNFSFFECTLCGSCSLLCPQKIDLDDEFIFQRTLMVKEKKSPEEIHKLMINLKKTGNIFGIIENSDE